MSSAGAGPSSAAPASSAAAAGAASAAAGASAGSVFVKRAGDLEAVFAPVEILSGDAVGHLAERASAKFRWLVGADKVKLFLVSTDFAEAVEGGDESAGIAAKKLFSGASLAHAGVSNGAFLLARLPDPPVAAAGECARAARSLLPCSPSRGAGGARGTCERFRRDLRGALTPFPFSLLFLSLRRRRWRRRWGLD
jgi:hypothetical protein